MLLPTLLLNYCVDGTLLMIPTLPEQIVLCKKSINLRLLQK